MKQRAIRRARMRHNLTMSRSVLEAVVAVEVSRQSAEQRRAMLAAFRRSFSSVGVCA